MTVVLFAAGRRRWGTYEGPLTSALSKAGVAAEVVTEADPEIVDYIIYAPGVALVDFRPFTRLKAVLNIWAGVEGVVGNETLTVPLCRMVEEGLTDGMVEWVTGQVLRHHLGLDRYITGTDPAWDPVFPPVARGRTVGILGLGELGSACAVALAALKFNVLGWSRSEKTIPGVETHHGPEAFEGVLERTEILVLLLPASPATENIINARAFACLPKGAVVINPGRGPLIDDDALVAALDAGHVAHATLDVFRTEPLPDDHPYWSHPRVTVTPHVASETRVDTAVTVLAENIRRGEAGEPFLHRVDRALGY